MVKSENISDSSYEHLNPDDATNIKNNDGPSLKLSGKIDEDRNTKTKHKDKMDENANSKQSHLDTDLGRIHITEEETVIEDINYVTEIENEDLKEVKTVITEERKLLSDGEECITYVVTTYIVHEPESFKDLLSDDDEDTFYTIPNDDTDIDLSLDDDDETTQDENVVPEIVDDVFFIPKGVKAQNDIADDKTKEGNNTKISSDEVKPRKIPKLSADMNIRIPKETASLSGEKEFYNLTPITPVEVIDFPFGEDDKEKEIEAPVNKKSKPDIKIIEISSDEEDSTEQNVGKNSDFEDVSEESNPMQENTTGLKIVEVKHETDETEESKGSISQNIEIIVISSEDEEDSLETDFSKIRDADSHIENSDTNSIVEEKTETIIISSDEEKEERIEMCYEEENKQQQSSENPIYIIENDIIIVDISDEEDSLEENNRVNLKTELEQADMYLKENNKPEFKEEGEENRVDKNKTPSDVIKIIDDTETTVENEVYSEDSLEEETDKNNVNNNNNNNNNVITPCDENASENKSSNEIEVKKEAVGEESEFSKAIDSTITPFENIKVEIKLENPIQDPITPIEVVVHVPGNETSENMNNDAENLQSKDRQSGKKSPFTIIYVPDEDTSSNDTNKVKEESNTTSMNRNTGSVKDIAKNQSNNETDFEEIDFDNYLEKNVEDTNTIDKNMNAATDLNDRNKENVHSSFCDVDAGGNNKEVARENKEGGRIDFVKGNQEKIMTPIKKEILFDMGNIKQDVVRNEIQIENQEDSNETQVFEIEDNMMNLREDNERNKEDDQNILESSEDEDTLDNIPEIEIDCSESNEQSAHLDIIACNDPEAVLMVDDDAMDNNVDTAIIEDQENMEDDQNTKTNPVEMSFVDEVVMKGEYIKEDYKDEEAAMEIDMDENVNTEDALKTKNYPNNQNLYDKENVPPIQCLENQTKKDKLSQTSIGNKDVEFVVKKCMIDLIDLITTLGMKNKENDSFYENDPIVACVQNKIDEMQNHPDKNMKKQPVKLSKYQQFENTPFLAIGRNIVTRKPNTKRVKKGKKKTKETKKENETLDVAIITQNNQTLVKPIDEESKEEFSLYYPLGNESDVSIYPIILDFERNEIEVADTVALMNESDNYNESAVEGDFDRKNSESSEKENDKSEENKTESFCLDLAINKEENTEKELELANTAQTDDSSDLIPEKTEDIKSDFSSDDPLIEENSNTFSSMTIIDSNTFSSMTIIDSIENDTESISKEPLIIEEKNYSLDQINENEVSRNNETGYRTEDEFSSDSIPEDSEERKTESFAEEPLIHEEDQSEDPSNDIFEDIEVITNSSDEEALIEDKESSGNEIIENPGKEKNENNDTEPLIKREDEDLNPMPGECEEILGDISISEPLVSEDDSFEDSISGRDTLITDNSEDTIEEITNDEPLIEEEDTSTNTMNSEVNIIKATIKDQILQDLITENPDKSTSDSSIAGLLLNEEDSTSIEIITEDTSVEPLVHEVETITDICDEELTKPASSVQLVKEYDKTFDQTSDSFEDIKTETTSLEIFHEDKSFNETTDYFEENKFGLLLGDNGVSANTVIKNTEENGKEGSSSRSKNEQDNSDTNNPVDESSNENNLDDSNTEPLDNNDDDNENHDDDDDDDNNDDDDDDDDQDESLTDSIAEDSKNDETDSIKTELLLVVSSTDEMIFSCDLIADDEDPGLQKGDDEDPGLQKGDDEDPGLQKGDDEDPGLQKGDDELFDSDIAIVNDVLEKMIDEIAEDETLREGDMEAERELCFSPCLIDPESILEENTDSQSSPENPPQVYVKLNVKIREELRKGKEDIAMVYAIEERTTGKKINNEQRVYIDVQEADGETATHSIDIKQADEYLAPFIGPHAEDDIPCEENIGDKKTDECCEGSVDDKNNVDTSFEEILNTEDVDGSFEETNGTKRPDEDVNDEDDSDPFTEEESNTNDAKHNKEDLAIASEEEREASVTDENDTKTVSTSDENDTKTVSTSDENDTKTVSTSDENDTKTVSNSDENDTKTVSPIDEEKLVLRDISHNEEDLIIASSLPEELELVSVINSILESIEENQKVDNTTKENEKVDDTTTKENEKPKSNVQSDESVSKSDEGTPTSVMTIKNNTTNANIPPEGNNNNNNNLDDLVDEEESILIPLTEVQVTLAYNDIVRLDADKATNNLESAENSTDLSNQNSQTSVSSQPRRKVYYPEKYPNYNPTPPPSPVYQPNQIKRSKKLFPPIPKPVSYHAEYINTNKNPRVLRRGPNQSKSADITTYTYKGSISSVGEFVSERKTKANIEDQNNVDHEDQKKTDVQNDSSLIDDILGNRDSIKIDDNKNEEGENKSTNDAKVQDREIDDKSLSFVDDREPDNNNNQKLLEEKKEKEENDETVNEGERVITHEERVKRRKKLEEHKQDEEAPFTGEKVISAEDRRLRRLQLIKVE